MSTLPMTLNALPRPKGKFLIGNLADFRNDPLEFVTKCARSEYSDIVPLRLGSLQACLLTNPDYIAQVLLAKQQFLMRSRGFRVLRPVLGEGLFFSDGDTWLRQRRLTQPIFNHKRIASYGEVMVAYTEQMLKTWQDGETRDINADMMRLTLNIVMKTIFTLDLTQTEAKDINHALNMMMAWYETNRKLDFRIPYWFPTPVNIRCKQAIKQMDKTIYSIISRRRTSGEDRGDLLSMFMQARDEEDGSQMTDKELRDLIASLILAGHESTANSLALTGMLLSKHPEVETKLLQELKEVLNGRSPTVADLPRLCYTEMVIKEALRLYPVLPIVSRSTTQACEIGGYHIPAKCLLMMSPWVMHRDPRYFEEPELFKPERWANNLEKHLPKGVYFPFSDGYRNCIGKGFAMMESTLILATIAQKFQMTLVPDHPVVLQYSAALRPQYGIRVVLQKR